MKGRGRNIELFIIHQMGMWSFPFI